MSTRQYVYIGESGGGRIIRCGTDDFTRATTSTSEPVLLALYTWDLVPAGEAGDNVFREIIATVRYENGYSIRITPIVDGIELGPQEFNGAGAGVKDCQAYIDARYCRGARVAAIVEQIVNTGPLELLNVASAFVPIRQVP